MGGTSSKGAMMSDKNTISRRSFLKLGAGALALGVVPPTLADARINIGMIGLGKQGRRLLSQLLALPNVRITALCDVVQPVLVAADAVARSVGHTPRLTQDYRNLLSGDDLQAVVIATPDFSHTPLALMALEQGKDVYLEIPLTRTIQEFETLQNTAQQASRILYTGISTQPKYAVAAGLVRAGLLGTINRIHIVANTPSREPSSDLTEPEVAWDQFLVYLAPRAFDAALLSRWQEHQSCSDGAAIAQVAQALRVVHQVMGVSHPTRVTAHGGTYVWHDGRDNPDTFYTMLDYAEGFVVQFAMHPGHSTSDVFMIYGTRDPTCDRSAFSCRPERNAT
jgi:predicted dehydrogenase